MPATEFHPPTTRQNLIRYKRFHVVFWEFGNVRSVKNKSYEEGIKSYSYFYIKNCQSRLSLPLLVVYSQLCKPICHLLSKKKKL